MDYIKIIGFVAAFLTTISFFPQAYKTIKTRDTSGISMMMYSAFTAGILFWLLYGLLRNDLPMILGNFITLIPAIIVLILKIKGLGKNDKFN